MSDNEFERAIARRDEKSENYKRGVLEAEAQAKDNLRTQIQGGLSHLGLMTAGRDASVAGRAAYDRAWFRLKSAVDLYYSNHGDAIAIPAHIAPPAAASDVYVPTQTLPPSLGLYEERGSPKRNVGVPGSAEDWLALSGDAK